MCLFLFCHCDQPKCPHINLVIHWRGSDLHVAHYSAVHSHPKYCSSKSWLSQLQLVLSEPQLQFPVLHKLECCSVSVRPFIRLHCSVFCVLCHHHYFFIFAESSPSHPSVTTHSLPPALCEDNDEFSDFQGPLGAPASFPTPSSSSTSSTFSFSAQARTQPSPSDPKTGFSEDNDDFSDFVQGPVNVFPSSNSHLSSQENQVQPSSLSLRADLSSSSSSLPQSLSTSVSTPTVTQSSAVNTSSQSTFQGNSSFALFTPLLPSS